MHSHQMKFSFVIPSYDRKEVLQTCIKSIEKAYECAKEKDIATEIVVVFCGINMEKSSFDLKYQDLTITQYSEENIVCRAKNIGIEKARGEYIVLIDDDATVGENFLLKLNELVQYEGNVYCAKIQDPVTAECFSEKEKSLTGRKLRRVDYNLFKGSALIIKKAVLMKAGLFSEEFGPGGQYFSAEESDLFFRIKMLKEDVLYVPELVIYHPVYDTFPESNAYRYSYATGAMLTKYCFDDWSNMYAYLFLIARLYAICSVRIIQTTLFPRLMSAKNEKRRYSFVVRGLTMGIIQYLKNRLLSGN